MHANGDFMAMEQTKITDIIRHWAALTLPIMEAIPGANDSEIFRDKDGVLAYMGARKSPVNGKAENYLIIFAPQEITQRELLKKVAAIHRKGSKEKLYKVESARPAFSQLKAALLSGDLKRIKAANKKLDDIYRR